MNFLNYWEIGGVFVTSIIVIITYVRSGDSPKWNLILTVSLLGLIFSFLISIRYEIIPRIEKAQLLAYQLTRNQIATDVLQLLLAVKESSYYGNNDVFKDQFDENISNLQTVLKLASDGDFVVPKDDIPLFSDKLINSADESIIATSYVKGTEWWLSHWGREYESINYDLRKKGITITRFFIFSNRKEFEEMKDLIRRHINNKIETYVVFNWESSYVHTEDLILVDRKISGRLVLDPEKNMKRAIMSVNPRAIRDIEGRFRKIRKASMSAQVILGGK
jgi:hypothetical protein